MSVSNEKRTLIFIPDTLEKEIGFLEGTIVDDYEECSIYITGDKLLPAQSLKSIGYSSENSPSGNTYSGDSKWVHVNSVSGAVTLNNTGDGSDPENVLIIYYNHRAFVQSQLIKSPYLEEHVETLGKKLSERARPETHTKPSRLIRTILLVLMITSKFLGTLEPIFKYSATATQLRLTIDAFKWALKEKPSSLRLNNFIVARFIDLTVGLIVLYCFVRYEGYVSDLLQKSTEAIITGLKDLLGVLMGSPAGLKLNYAFNRALGTFFFYHISLWRAFLRTVTPLVRVAFRTMALPGMLGLTFQAALLEDLVGFVTFHVYCIYVYAARLYGLQIRALVSLWRLFIGRKYNPLRDRVDSCQYTHHQLFIGTLGFTIFLFLLPTTLLYYMVFAMLRLGILMLNGTLLRLRYLLQCFPLYVTILWIVNSNSVAGSVRFTFKQVGHRRVLYCTLTTLPLMTVINNSSPKTLPTLPNISWGKYLHSLITGVLL